MSLKTPIATSPAAAPGLFTQVGMAGGAAVITVSFIHPIDVVKVGPERLLEYGNLVTWLEGIFECCLFGLKRE